jgi:WD40 repeat protein
MQLRRFPATLFPSLLHGRYIEYPQWTASYCSRPHFSINGKCYILTLRVGQLTRFKPRFKPAKIFTNAVEAMPPPSPSTYPGRPAQLEQRHITGISFDDRGDQVLTAAEDETFRLYSCKTGKQVLHLDNSSIIADSQF